jgi:metal-responsive CopG/Arc/MetJ family transcriptional regulator
MVQQKEYKNSSNVIRDALIRLMEEKGGAIGDVELSAEDRAVLSTLLPSISSSIMLTIPANNPKLEKKLNKLEMSYHESIIHKSIFNYEKLTTITFILEDNMNTIQSFITELNALEELTSFRYIINGEEDI